MAKKAYHFIKEIYKQYNEDDIPALAAQVTYFMILSLLPFLMALISIVSLTKKAQLQDTLMQVLQDFLLPEVYDIVFEAITNALEQGSSFLSITGFILTFWLMGRAALFLIKGINKAYNLEETRSIIKLFFTALVFTVFLILIFVLALLLLVFGKALGLLFFNFLGAPELFSNIWNFLRYVITLLSLFSVFCLIYKSMPNKKIPLKEVIPGALFTTLTIILVSTIFSYYISNFGFYANAYGSIGGIILTLVWLNLNFTVIILGAEFNVALLARFKN